MIQLQLRREWLPSVLLVVSLVLSACGGGAGTSAKDGQDQQDTSGGGQATAAAATGAAAQGGDAVQVSDLTKKRRQATFKVAYKWTSGKDTAANETWYSKPPRSRIDHGDSTQQQWMSQFILPNGAFTCETSAGTPTCWKAATNFTSVEELSFIAIMMTTYEGLFSDPAFTASRETRTIAGQRGTCLRSSNVLLLGFAEITLCHASNGVPLLFQWKAGPDTFTMEATSYSGTVSDKDLELPAPPQN